METSQKKISHEGVLTTAQCVMDGEPKGKGKEHLTRAAILDLSRRKFTPSDIARLLKVRGVTIDEVKETLAMSSP